jgi:hypothetical protein
MGTGKSKAIMSIANSDKFGNDSNCRMIIIVPTKDEQKRFLVNCKGFAKPTVPPFREDIKRLLKEGRNIVTTHALCSIMSGDTRKLIRDGKYTYYCYIDEQPNFVRNIVGGYTKFSFDDNGNKEGIERFSANDLRLAQNNKILSYDKETKVIHYVSGNEYDITDNKPGVFQAFKEYDDIADMFNYGKNSKDENLINTIIALTKKEVFSVFKEVWVCSYMIRDSLLQNYCDFNNIGLDFYHLENDKFVKGYKELYPINLDRLVVVEDTKLLSDESLTKNCFAKDLRNNKVIMKSLSNKMRTFKTLYKVKSKDLYWTCFSDYHKELAKINSRNVPIRRYVPCNIKATNEYQNCHFVAYLCNRMINPNLSHFFESKDIVFDNNLYALSELIQVIWRSNIRVADSTDKVYVYIPNRRMRELFKDWLAKGIALQKNT